MSGWIRLRCGGTIPPACERATVVTMGQQIVMFGGCLDSEKRVNTVHVLDTSTLGL